MLFRVGQEARRVITLMPLVESFQGQRSWTQETMWEAIAMGQTILQGSGLKWKGWRCALQVELRGLKLQISRDWRRKKRTNQKQFLERATWFAEFKMRGAGGQGLCFLWTCWTWAPSAHVHRGNRFANLGFLEPDKWCLTGYSNARKLDVKHARVLILWSPSTAIQIWIGLTWKQER